MGNERFAWAEGIGEGLDPAAYALGRSVPEIALAPNNEEEATEIVRACHADKLRVAIWGSGSRAALRPPPESYHVALVCKNLRGILFWDAEDMVATFAAGTLLTDANELLKSKSCWLPWETEMYGPITIGGAIATDCAGSLEDGCGAPRDRVLELLVLTGSLETIRVGARVVKHSAGYGLHLLLCGSWGAFGLVLEATVRLEALPTRRVFSCEATAWAEVRRSALEAEKTAPSLLSFTARTRGDAWEMSYELRGPVDDLEAQASDNRLSLRTPARHEAAVRFRGEPPEVDTLVTRLQKEVPYAELLVRPVSGVVWLLTSSGPEPAIRIAQDIGLDWRVEKGHEAGSAKPVEVGTWFGRLKNALDPSDVFLYGRPLAKSWLRTSSET